MKRINVDPRRSRWLPLFEKFATQEEREVFERMQNDVERQFLYMRSVILSQLELLATASDGKLLAKILYFVELPELRQICNLSTTIYDVCKRYQLLVRHMAGMAIVDGEQLNVNRPVISIALGRGFIALVTDDGTLWSNSHRNQLEQIGGINEPVKEVWCGDHHCLVLTRDTERGFGLFDNQYGQLGNGNTALIQNNPSQIRINDPIRKMSCGAWHSAVLTHSGDLYLFGNGYRGTLYDYAYYEHEVTLPRLVQSNVLDVSLENYQTIFMTNDKIYLAGESQNGIVPRRTEEEIYSGIDAYAFKNSAGELRVNQTLIGNNVKKCIYYDMYTYAYITNDGELYHNGQLINTPLPVVDIALKHHYFGYVLSSNLTFSISLQCVQCAQPAQYFASDTHALYCSGKCEKRLRDEEEEEVFPMGRPRQDDPAMLPPTTMAILENPRRMEAFVNQLTKEQIVEISKSQGETLWARLNRDNLFWFMVSKRFIAVGFNRLINYKDIAGRLL